MFGAGDPSLKQGDIPLEELEHRPDVIVIAGGQYACLSTIAMWLSGLGDRARRSSQARSAGRLCRGRRQEWRGDIRLRRRRNEVLENSAESDAGE